MNNIRERVIREIKLHARNYLYLVNPQSRIVDIGTGTGLAAKFLSSLGFAVVGLDIRIYPEYLGDERVLYDGENMPFKDGEFDLGLLFYTLHHVHDAAGLLGRSRRIAGKLVVIEEFPDDGGQLDSEENVLQAIGLLGCPDHTHRTIKELEEIFTGQMSIIERVTLETETLRRVDKYLYILC